ncbi:RNA polymerase sigma factor [Polaribacter gangjinensis]|uniref:RNA polymerase subunit sigma-70 n=1 Tax=Polaribacter gangjinensis TaxID=574710 RepID=A0A2S7WEK0_9FLAO|nr:RNA polymerase sigma-70 factor [Polaribacter gangjinensis]PQJ76040.1 RNA polymerase subunit sigma-70 [Polaribacter gangjinensis]
MIRDIKNICNTIIFEEVFRKYGKDVKRFIFFKTKDTDLTEDIVQDAFVKLWEQCKEAKYDTVKNYLFTIANNLFLNVAKHHQVIDKHQKGFVHENSNETPEFLYIENEFYQSLQNAIAGLTEKQREVFMLSRMEKKKYSEIAAQLNLSVKAVEKRMHNALIALREKINII